MCPLCWVLVGTGNVPSLSRLLRAYISKAAAAIVGQQLLLPVLGVFQRLVTRGSTDHEGFAILSALTRHLPPYARSHAHARNSDSRRGCVCMCVYVCVRDKLQEEESVCVRVCA
jgi:hypothetical protein